MLVFQPARPMVKAKKRTTVAATTLRVNWAVWVRFIGLTIRQFDPSTPLPSTALGTGRAGSWVAGWIVSNTKPS